MTENIQDIQQALESFVEEKKVVQLPIFFKAFPGGYGEGDLFMGVSMPNIRIVAKEAYQECSIEEIQYLLKHDYHEMRMCGLIIMLHHYTKKLIPQDVIIQCYLDHLDYVNNWDLVDTSCYKLLGRYIYEGKMSNKVLYELSGSGHLWRIRVAIVATMYMIKKDDYTDAFALCEEHLSHDHDLIHKAVGWMLKEIGKRDEEAERDFLDKHYKNMSRTTLRYAIEKMDERVRQIYLKGDV
ncbi:DNA alkylation repair protein [Flammeovirga yaeyamensis]|uniref:DNA alkylation repair protein n=1 Tax=Flammeovirga yaeyamensis TaxID=367791 RepID=A0AAX1N6G7_9BACT|nr:DNA alkylation repair protein [Flammeovirga yaeyamensis]MBB3697663.1 3-methyladenine DNA glycosylase AlkD [Flammeovirga yaeyamensis]NMF35977.1 DNA alkylation repair protein [Flammeovirga yaeyamensis]QWG03076.1 DNA alkylation repair protein [Flammeovirga yaeyamensis]